MLLLRPSADAGPSEWAVGVLLPQLLMTDGQFRIVAASCRAPNLMEILQYTAYVIMAALLFTLGSCCCDTDCLVTISLLAYGHYKGRSKVRQERQLHTLFSGTCPHLVRTFRQQTH